MSVTPEGKVKKKVRDVIKKFDPDIYSFWPVPAGFGPSSLDVLICYRGFFIAVETKAKGKAPTPRQELCIEQINSALGTTFVIDGDDGVQKLEELLLWLKRTYPQSIRSLAFPPSTA